MPKFVSALRTVTFPHQRPILPLAQQTFSIHFNTRFHSTQTELCFAVTTSLPISRYILKIWKMSGFGVEQPCYSAMLNIAESVSLLQSISTGSHWPRNSVRWNQFRLEWELIRISSH